MVDAVKNYLEEGIPPGSFLTAVICNNFYQAVSSADDQNRKLLDQWANFFYNHVQANAWGSPEIMKDWLDNKEEKDDDPSKRFNLMYKPSSSSEKQVCPACRGNGFVRDEEGVGDCMVCDSEGEVLESFNLKTGD